MMEYGDFFAFAATFNVKFFLNFNVYFYPGLPGF